MKKLKFMLLSLALVAVVGGSLAFKATYIKSYCTAPTQIGFTCPELACPNLVNFSTTINGVGDFVCTTPTVPNVGCPEGLKCFTSTKIKADQ